MGTDKFTDRFGSAKIFSKIFKTIYFELLYVVNQSTRYKSNFPLLLKITV